MDRFFVENGVGAELSRESGEATRQQSGFVRCQGKGTVYAPGVALGKGDFLVRASLRLQEFKHTAASFHIGASHFGFDGGGKQLFVSRGWFGTPARMLVPAAKWLKDNEWFVFEAERKSGEFYIRLNGDEVLRQDVGDGFVGRFGFRPWRGTIDLREFFAEGEALQTHSSLSPGHDLPVLDLASDTERQVVVDREAGQYLGHPNTVLLKDNKTILCVYPKGHGRGAILYKRSPDGGKTWSERLPTPENWETSLETPTIHRLTDSQGIERLILFSGLYPIRRAVSEDEGKTWTPLEKIGDFGGIVAMGDVIRLKNGNYAAFFHDDGRFLRNEQKAGRFHVYQTISSDGGLSWGEPSVVCSLEHVDLCEPGVVRSPDGSTLAMVMRENSRTFNSFVVFSKDEAESWGEPRELPAALTGDRHQFHYADDGRLVAVFRDTTRQSETRGDFVAWVGSYADLEKGTEGQYRLRLLDNLHGCDCGYPGLELLPDGTFVATTYGHWIKDESPFVIAARFNLAETDRLVAATKPVEVELFTKGLGGYPSFRIPSLVTTKSGTLLAMCEGRGLAPTSHGDISGNHLVLRRSTDHGATWGKLEVLQKDGDNSLLGPCAVVSDSGRIIVVYHRYLPGTNEGNATAGFSGPQVVDVLVTTSDDDGRKWSAPRIITQFAKKEEWSGSILTGPGRAIQKQQAPNAGRIVVPCCHGPVWKWHDYVIYSDDDGESWALGGEIPTPLGNECQVVELFDGNLMLNARSYRGKGCRHTSLSRDGGLTWTPAKDEPALPEPICQGSIIRYQNSETGVSCLLFSNPADGKSRVNGTVRMSLDNGATWAHSFRINNSAFSYSCLTQLADGCIGCLYEGAGCLPRFIAFPLETVSKRIR